MSSDKRDEFLSDLHLGVLLVSPDNGENQKIGGGERRKEKTPDNFF
jgi:hypothetical protein